MDRRFKLVLLFVSIVLMTSLIFPSGVFADGETPVPDMTDDPAPTEVPVEVTEAPPATDPPEVTELPSTEAPIEVTPELIATDVIENPAPVETSSAVDVSAPVEEPQSEQTIPEILASLPDQTSVTVVNSEGQTEPLTTPEAAEIMQTGDPMWCPSGVLPGGVGCTPSFTSFSDLITYLDTNNISGAGTVYVSNTYSSASEASTNISFDPAALSLSNLVIQGGWDFGTNTVVGTSTLSGVNLLVGDFTTGSVWGGSVTLNDLILSNSPGRAINVNASGNVTVDNVSVTGANSAGTGNAVGVLLSSTNGNVSANELSVSNSTAPVGFYGSGAAIIADSGNVSLTNSTFTNNSGFGVRVTSAGNVMIDNVNATNNGRNGLEVTNTGSNALISVSNSTFNNNGTSLATGAGMGMIVTASGSQSSLTLQNVVTSANSEIGLAVSSNSATINGVTANNNGIVGAGLMLNTLSLSNSTFSGNGTLVTTLNPGLAGAGLIVESSLGATLNQVTADNNYGAGMYLNSSDQSISGNPMPASGGGFTVVCSSASNNGYGVIGDLDDTVQTTSADGVLILQGVQVVNNAFGDTLILSGSSQNIADPCEPDNGNGGGNGGKLPVSSIYSSSASQRIGAQNLIALDCSASGPTVLRLTNGTTVKLGCPTGDHGQLIPLDQNTLPGEMPAGVNFAQALQVDIVLNGISIPPMSLGGYVEIDFPIPQGIEGKQLIVYFWDPAKNNGAGGWVELPWRSQRNGAEVVFSLRQPGDALSILTGVHIEDNLLNVRTNFPGIFLVTTK